MGLSTFLGRNSDNQVTLEYEITSQQPSGPFEIEFFVSLDARFDPGVDSETGYKVRISPDSIRDNPNLSLLDESPDEALKEGKHTLLIRPNGTALGAALEDPHAEAILAVADPEGTEPFDTRTATFRGFYHGEPGSRLVVRPGLGSDDVVTIGPGLDVTFVSDEDETTRRQLGIDRSTVSDVLVVSSTGDDRIVVDAEIDTVLNGGAGDDEYVFRGFAGGHHLIIDKPRDGTIGDFSRDTLDFAEFHSPIRLDLSSTSRQDSGGLAITLDDDRSIEVVYGTRGDDRIIGNSRPNFLYGDEGDDHLEGGESRAGSLNTNILVGGPDDDTLIGGDQTDVLIGDDYRLKRTKLSEFLNNLLLFKWALSVKAEPSGSGDDKLIGGGGFDVLIGGHGNDTLEGGNGGGLLFGDAIGLSIGTNIDLKKVIEEATSTEDPSKSKGLLKQVFAFFAPGIDLVGDGNDTITGGSGIDVIFGGDGDDTIDSGGGFADLIFGGEDDDDIDARQSFFSFVVGGGGDDTIDAAGMSGALGSVLIGDDFDFSTPDLKIEIDFEQGRFTKLTVGAGLVPRFDGKDKLTATFGDFNVLIGGDGDDELIAGGSFTFIMGDSFNLGAEFSIDFAKMHLSTAEKLALLRDNLRLPGLQGSGDDIVRTSGDVNVVVGGGGDDVITGGDGLIDLLFGNDGNDVIVGGEGFNLIVGGDDHDILVGGDDGNVILGDTYDFKHISGFPFMNFLIEGRLNFTPLRPDGNGDDTLIGGAGNDLLIGGAGDDILDAGDGSINIMFGDEVTVGQELNLDLLGFTKSLSTATVLGLLSPFVLTGEGEDQLYGGSGRDLAFGGGGNDTIVTGSGIDALFGGDGDDYLDGGVGSRSFLFGGEGRDRIKFHKPLSMWTPLERLLMFLWTDFDPDEDEEVL